MVIYFDESYDGAGEKYLIFGALFNPHSKFLHRKICEIKKKNGFQNQDDSYREIKYNNCKNAQYYGASTQMIDAFFESTSWFRCIVVSMENFDWDRFGKAFEQEKIKKARAYKKFAELLLANNCDNIQGGILLTDQLTRCSKDLFMEKMKELFCAHQAGYSAKKRIPTLTRIEEIQSHLESYQVNQICDLLMGCVLNNLIPTENKYKIMIREYLIKKAGVKDLLPASWLIHSKAYVEAYHPKFNIWYLKLKKKTQVS